jgi:hypothetical protein
MRTYRKIYLSIVLVVLCTGLYSQTISFRGGVSSSPADNLDGSYGSLKNNVGINAGMLVDVPIYKFIEMSTSLSYIEKTKLYQYQNECQGEYSANVKYLQLPVQWKLTKELKKNFKLYARAGVFTSYAHNDRSLERLDGRAQRHEAGPALPFGPEGAPENEVNRKQEGPCASLQAYGQKSLKTGKEEGPCAGWEIYRAERKKQVKEEGPSTGFNLTNRGEVQEEDKNQPIWSNGLSASIGLEYKTWSVELSYDQDLGHMAPQLKNGKIKNTGSFSFCVLYSLPQRKRK